MSNNKYRLRDDAEMIKVAVRCGFIGIEADVLLTLLLRERPWYARPYVRLGLWWARRKAVRQQLQNLDEGRAELITRADRKAHV